jgi:KaiC/GvpD/RAD55 family RecA-like ATPase
MHPNKDVIKQYLSDLTAPQGDLDACWEIRFIPPDREPGKPPYSIFKADPTTAIDEIAQSNEYGYNVYVGINPRKPDAKSGTASDVLCALWHVADCDDKLSSDNLAAIVSEDEYLVPEMVVTTGTEPETRLHAYWRLEDPSYNMAAWSDIQKGIAITVGSDDKIIDPPRIMRLAGTISHPSTTKASRGYKPEVTTYERNSSSDAIAAQEFQSLFGFDLTAKPDAEPSDSFFAEMHEGRTSKEVYDLLQASRQSGEWYFNMRSAVSSLIGKGFSDGEIRMIVGPYCDGGFADKDLDPFLHDMRRDWNMPSPKDRTESRAEVADIHWGPTIKPALDHNDFVKGVISEGALSLVYGPSNVGKTFFVADIAMHVAAGMQWRDRRINGGAVIYIAMEGMAGISNRVVAWRNHYRQPLENFGLLPATYDLCKSETDPERLLMKVQEAQEAIQQPIKLIVIDTLARAMAGGSENAGEDMGLLIRHCDMLRNETGAHVLLVHHSGKSAEQGARGHSSLRAAVDTEIELSKDEDGPAVAIVRKQRDMEINGYWPFALEPVVLGVDQEGNEVTSCIVVPVDQSEMPQKKRKLSKDAQTLEDAFEEVRTAAPLKRGVYDAASLPETRIAFERKIRGSVQTKSAAWAKASRELEDRYARDGDVLVRRSAPFEMATDEY